MTDSEGEHELNQRQLMSECLREIPLIMDKLDRSGLHASARLMDKVVKRVGYEVAERLQEMDAHAFPLKKAQHD